MEILNSRAMNCDSWKTKAIALSLDDFAASLLLHAGRQIKPHVPPECPQTQRMQWHVKYDRKCIFMWGESERVNSIFMAQGSFNNNKIRFSTQKKSAKQ